MPSYTMDKATTYLTCGLGYRYGRFISMQPMCIKKPES